METRMTNIRSKNNKSINDIKIDTQLIRLTPRYQGYFDDEAG